MLLQGERLLTKDVMDKHVGSRDGLLEIKIYSGLPAPEIFWLGLINPFRTRNLELSLWLILLFALIHECHGWWINLSEWVHE